MKRYLLLLMFTAVTVPKSNAQITAIADYRFERALVDLGIDSDQLINGHISTADAFAVTELNLSPNGLPNYPYPANDIYDGMIHDLSGLEAFVNLEHLVVNVTMVDHLDLTNLTHLKYLDCVDNMLTSINVSNNPLLEYLDISGGGDVTPFNYINAINLSNNPNINYLKAFGTSQVNLHNNHNLTNMLINIGCSYCWDYPDDFISGNICIEVDDVALAQTNQPPYSGWNVYHPYASVNYTDNLIVCALGTSAFQKDKFVLYPNPATGLVHIQSNDKTRCNVIVFDALGRKMIEKEQVSDSIDISTLQKGNYFVKILSADGTRTEKLIVE